MKKLIIATVAIFALVGIAPAQAETKEAIAIIDANFNAGLISGDVVEVCVVAASSCARKDLPRNAGQFKNFNHGTIMADIVRSNNPDAKIILIRAATVTTGVVNAAGFEDALDWVQANRNTYNIVSVSFSYNVGNGSKCIPTSTGIRADVMHNDIVNDISNLLAMNTKVYAAAGNHGTSKVDYPACISDVVSVGSTLYRGSMPFADIILGPNAYVSSVLKSNTNRLQDSSEISNVGSYPVAVGNTTSVATAIAAATN